MKIGAAFPSNYLKAADLGIQEWALTMSRIQMEDIGSDHKPVLYFHGAEKGLVLNRTNAEMITLMHGDETDNWSGKQIVLKADKTQFQGKIVDCIRVVWHGNRGHAAMPAAAQAPLGNGNHVAPAQPAPAPAMPGGAGAPASDPLDGDSIPFAVPFDISKKRGYRA